VALETMRALASDGLVKNKSEQGYGMAEQNAYQVADWNGQSGERWVAYQARLDAMVAVFGQAAIEAAAPATGERVLARISHRVEAHRGANQRKFFCEKDFGMIQGTPRCRQSVAQNSLILEGWKAVLWKRPLMAAL
jgi:hypothetical protein